VLLGNELLFQEMFIPLPAELEPASPGQLAFGWLSISALWHALTRAMPCTPTPPRRSGLYAALIQAKPLRILMLTGDSAAAAAPIAEEAGISEVEAGLDPGGKLARVRALQSSGLRVAMVGDGINDAAALAQADAGIAMGTGPTSPRKPAMCCFCARGLRRCLPLWASPALLCA